jgi:hypothetical protein
MNMAIASNRILGALLGLVLLPGAAFAETYAAPTWPIGNPPAGWRPAPFAAGSWFDPARNGSGWAIEKLSPLAGQTAPLYAGTVYTYDSAGKPYWLLMAGTLQYTGWDEYFRTGVSAKFGGVLNDGVNGACPTCAYVAPNVGPSPYGTGEIRFLGAAQANVYVNNGTTQVERIQASENILLNPVAELLEGEWTYQTYRASGSIQTASTAESIYEIAKPVWASAITADANIMHAPAPNGRWFVVGSLGVDYPIVYDAEVGTLIGYCFEVATGCGTETIGSTGGLSVPGRVGFHMRSSAYVHVYSLIDKNTMTDTTFVNNKDIIQNSPLSTNSVSRYRRVIPIEQQ